MRAIQHRSQQVLSSIPVPVARVPEPEVMIAVILAAMPKAGFPVNPWKPDGGLRMRKGAELIFARIMPLLRAGQ